MVAGLLFFFSGAAGLVYEVLWFRLLILELGGTGLSVAAVTAAFMAGLGAGAWWLGARTAPRIAPMRLYGLLEIAIGAYALVVPTLIHLAGKLDALVLGPEPGAAGRAARFLIAGAVLVPATFCMGGTLPVLSRLIAKSRATPGRFVGLLYGLNTLGAMLGAGATGFYLLPGLGLRRTIWIAAGVNVLLGVAAIALSRGMEAVHDAPSDATPKSPDTPGAGSAGLALIASATAGLVGFVVQVAWTRILALVFGSSVYAFSLILVLFLLGLGGGALAGSYAAGRARTSTSWLAWCFVGIGAAVLAGEAWFGHIPRLYLDALVASGSRSSLGGAAWLTAAVLLPPTFLLGAVFPFVVRLATGNRGTAAASGVGRLYAANTAGGVIGAWTAALLLIPTLGLMGSVSVSGVVALSLGVVVAMTSGSVLPPAARWAPAAAAIAAVAGWLFLVPAWDRGVMSLGVGLWGPHAIAQGRDVEQNLVSLSSDEILYYREGVTATVSVKEAGKTASTPGQRYLSVDGHIEASDGGDMPTQVLVGQIPLLASRTKNPSVLVVGYASGVTVGSILTQNPSSVTVVELEKAVVAAGGQFDHVNGRPLEDPRVKLVVDDARAYLTRTDRRFDVIVSEPSSVWLTGPSKLFTAETFRGIRARLTPGGIAGEWVSSYDVTPEDILTVVRTFKSVFPHVAVVQLLADADLLLLGSDAPLAFELGALSAAAENPRVRADFDRIGVSPVCGVLDRIAADPEAVARNIPPGPLNTDDNALLEYRGARTRGELGERAALAVLSANARGPAAMVTGFTGGAGSPERLATSCLQEGAMRTAASLASQALASGPNAEASWIAGEALRAQAKRVEALGRFAEAQRSRPDHVPSAISTGLTLQEMDRLPEAIAAWDRAAGIAPSEALIPSWRGVARLESGDARGAVEDFRAARALVAPGRPAPIPLDLYEARALQEAGRDQEARPVLERAVAAYEKTRDASDQAVAAMERLAGILAASPDGSLRAAELRRAADEARRQSVSAILGGALQIEDASGSQAARAYLRGLMRMDPALPALLRSAAGAAPERVRARVVELVAGAVVPSPPGATHRP